MMFGITSCDLFKPEQNPEQNPGGDEIIIPDGGKDEDNKEPVIDELTPDEQKSRLEKIANNLMNEYPARGFDDLMELGLAFGEEYLESDYDWDPFFEFCEDRGYEIFFEEENRTEVNGEVHYDWSLLALMEMSDLKGKIVLGSSSVSCTDYDGTQMIFTLDGKEYVAEMTYSGKVTTLKYTFEDIYGYEINDGYYDESSGYWVDDYVLIHYNDKYHFEVDVPENMNIVITEDGSEFASVAIGFDVESGKEVNITKDCLFISVTAEIDGNEFILEKSGYDAAKDRVSLYSEVRKDGKSIASVEFSAKAEFGLVTEREENDYGEYYQDTYLDIEILKDFKVSADILGELQIKGTCSNGITLGDYIDNFYSSSNESQVERAVDNINNCLDLYLYYDGTDVVQAEIIMDYYVEDDYYDTYYELEPIIVFPDGSKYAFYEYFDEDSFNDLIESFELWIEQYEDMSESYY